MITRCKVKIIKPVTAFTYQVVLLPEQSVSFKAGQYLMIEMQDEKRAFSLANSPSQSQGELELHIGAAEHNPYAMEVVSVLQSAFEQNTWVTIDAPHGQAHLQQQSINPLLLVAGGTGFSYAKSILDECIALKKTQPIYFYWGVRDESQLYAQAELEIIAQHNPHIKLVVVVEHSNPDWQGRTGNLLVAINQDFNSLADMDVYIAGRVEMVLNARKQWLAEKQLNNRQIYSDVFSYNDEN